MLPVLMITMFLLAVLLVMVILVQRGRGGGLAGAFGSGGGSSSAFGTKTGDVFTTVTVAAFVIFMLLSIWASFEYKWAAQPLATATAPAVGAGGAATLPVMATETAGATLPSSEIPATASAPATATTHAATTQPAATATAPAATSKP